MKIGPMSYGSPEVTTGGQALKFYSTLRLEIRRYGFVKGSDDAKIGSQVRVKVVKNKIAPPFKEATFEILYGRGISREGELIDLGAVMDIVDKSGAWFSYNGERLGNGKENSRRFLQDNPDVARSIEEKLKGAYGLLAERVSESISVLKDDSIEEPPPPSE
jgi:recombination protein RecA